MNFPLLVASNVINGPSVINSSLIISIVTVEELNTLKELSMSSLLPEIIFLQFTLLAKLLHLCLFNFKNILYTHRVAPCNIIYYNTDTERQNLKFTTVYILCLG